MNLSLPADVQRLIDERVRSGKYRSAEDVIAAALMQLDQLEEVGDFEAGELDALLAEGEQSGEALEGEQVFAELRDMRQRGRTLDQPA
jgi:putative addiction module CopG family antidote